tara:strand:- start:4421 stop:5374 length:954 start_codon:yes stop_codon:yes gene_type:complete
MGIFDEEAVDTDDYLEANEVEEEEVEEEVEFEEEPEVEAAPEQQASEPENNNVPLQELLYERRRRQELERKLDGQGQNLAIINERLQQAAARDQQAARQAQVQKEQEERPDEEEDPVGHANWRINQVERQLQGLGQMARQGVDLHRSLVNQNQHQSIISQSQSLQNDFAQKQPDYWDAYNFLIDTRRNELKAMGYDGPSLEQVIDNEKSMIVQNSMNADQNGQFQGWKQNPAAVVYQLATQRGFRGAQAPQQAPQQSRGQQRVERLAEGVRSATGSAGSRGAGGSPHSLETLAQMTDAEFDRFRRANPGVLESMLGA